MDIFVVSRSRFEKSDTLERLRQHVANVRLVVPSSQVSSYRGLAAKYACDLVGCPQDGIARTRQFCGQITTSWCFLMLDDDLKFYRRVSPNDTRLRYPEDLNVDVGDMLRCVKAKLCKYVHVSISAREGNNRLPYEGVECSRPLRALAYRTAAFRGLIHGRVQVMEDFDVTLQLLRQGHKNHVIASWSQGQQQTQMAGGCSDYRTHEVHAENVRKFAELHKGFVKLREKRNKSGGDFGHRLEATIYWQRAWESSQRATRS